MTWLTSGTVEGTGVSSPSFSFKGWCVCTVLYRWVTCSHLYT